MASFILFWLGFFLAFSSVQWQLFAKAHVIGRVFFALSIILFYVQIFHFFVINKYLGPKVIIAYTMVFGKLSHLFSDYLIVVTY